MFTFLVKMRVFHQVGHFARKRADVYEYVVAADDATDAAFAAIHLLLDEAATWTDIGMKITVRDIERESVECIGVTVPA